MHYFDTVFSLLRLINTAVIIKIHTVEWTPAILNNTAIQAGLNVNFGLSPGREVLDWLKAHNISSEASGSVLQPLVGNPSEFYGVPFSLTEEFVSVYRMHPLLPDTLYMRSLETGQRTGKSYSLPEYSFRNAKKVMRQSVLGDVVYTFGVEHPGALTLHNYPTHLMNLKLPKRQQNGEVNLNQTDASVIHATLTPWSFVKQFTFLLYCVAFVWSKEYALFRGMLFNTLAKRTTTKPV